MARRPSAEASFAARGLQHSQGTPSYGSWLPHRSGAPCDSRWTIPPGATRQSCNEMRQRDASAGSRSGQRQQLLRAPVSSPAWLRARAASRTRLPAASSSPPRRREPRRLRPFPSPRRLCPRPPKTPRPRRPPPRQCPRRLRRRSRSSSRADRDMQQAASRAPGIFSLRALGTTALVAVTEPEALLSARGTLLQALRAVDLACSRFRPDSELMGLNAANGATRRVGPVLWWALVAALETARATDGLVDPTVGKAMRLAGYDRTFSRIALRDGALVAATFVPCGRWTEIAARSRLAYRAPTGRRRAHLGASAKALTADRVAHDISETTGSGVLVSLGGDIALAGTAPAGGWVVALADDHSIAADTVSTRVSIESGGLAELRHPCSPVANSERRPPSHPRPADR